MGLSGIDCPQNHVSARLPPSNVKGLSILVLDWEPFVRVPIFTQPTHVRYGNATWGCYSMGNRGGVGQNVRHAN